MPFYFYLARCADNSLYCGSCKDLTAREAKHNAGEGAKYTCSRRPVRMVYSEEFSTLVEAMRREAQVKNWSKEKKERLAAGKHPMKNTGRKSYNVRAVRKAGVIKLDGANMDIDLTSDGKSISWKQDKCPWNIAEGTDIHKCAMKNISICPYFCGVECQDNVLCCYPNENSFKEKE